MAVSPTPGTKDMGAPDNDGGVNDGLGSRIDERAMLERECGGLAWRALLYRDGYTSGTAAQDTRNKDLQPGGVRLRMASQHASTIHE